MSLRTGISRDAVFACLFGLSIAGKLSDAAQGADLSLGLRKIDQNTVTALSGAQESEPKANLTLGLAYERDETGSHSLAVPFLYDYNLSPWDFQISGAYTRNANTEGGSTGFSDVSVAGARTYKPRGNVAVTPSFTINLPTHGQVGSSRLSEEGDLLLALGDLRTLTIEGRFDHTPVPGQSPRISENTQTILGGGEYSWNCDTGGNCTDAIMKVSRAYTRGNGGNSTIFGQFDFPIRWKQLKGSLIASQGLSAGQRRKSIELDLSRDF
jgi:hypothetical protein